LRLAGCAPTGLDGTNGPVATAEESTAGIADAPPVEAISPANATIITIPGCCRFTVPAGATVSSPSGIPVDGFRQYWVTLNGETTWIQPFLGAHGWLEAAGGAVIHVDGRPARERPLDGGAAVTVIPLHAQIDGRNTLLSLRVRADCAGYCALYRSVVESLEIETRWSAQQIALGQ